MSEELALGQRELEPNGTFVPTEEEKALLDTNNLSPQAVQSFVDISGKQTINAAIGGLKQKLANDEAGKETAIPPKPEEAPSAPEASPEAPEGSEKPEVPETPSEPTGEAPSSETKE